MQQTMAPRRGLLTPGGWTWTWTAVLLPFLVVPLVPYSEAWGYAICFGVFNLLACRLMQALPGVRTAMPPIACLLAVTGAMSVFSFAPLAHSMNRGRETTFGNYARQLNEQNPQP